MFLDNTAYTATLIHYVAQLTGRTVADTAITIGQYNVARLCHNAPMNQILPISKIAREVIYDIDLYRYGTVTDGVLDPAYGAMAMELVKTRAAGKPQYAAVLYDILAND